MGDLGPIPISWSLVGALISAIAGYVVRGFTLSKKERLDVQQVAFANAKELAQLQNDRFNELVAALTEYSNATGKPTLDQFAKITRSAQTYFYQQQITADAILSGKVDAISRDNTLMKKLIDTTERTLPQVYSVLSDIATKNGFSYPVEFERSNYESIFSAVEKYGAVVQRSSNASAQS